jgi:hypothetical protein
MTINGKPPTKEQKKLIDAHNLKMQQRQFENALAESTTRARSVMIGTAFGGASEISMRRVDGTVIFAILQPVEVVELINQMAASIGCHIHIQPRKDFASWREWKYSQEELDHARGIQHQPGVGHPPHAKAMIDGGYSTQLPPPEQQPGLQPAMMARSESNEQTVATQKTVGRKRTKRAAAPT